MGRPAAHQICASSSGASGSGPSRRPKVGSHEAPIRTLAATSRMISRPGTPVTSAGMNQLTGPPRATDRVQPLLEDGCVSRQDRVERLRHLVPKDRWRRNYEGVGPKPVVRTGVRRAELDTGPGRRRRRVTVRGRLLRRRDRRARWFPWVSAALPVAGSGSRLAWVPGSRPGPA